MNCQNVARCVPLNGCPTTGASLYIGSLSDGYDPYSGTITVRFTDMATGRQTVLDNAGALPDVECQVDNSFVAGHVYRVEVLDQGGYPLAFYVYQWDTTANDRDLSTDDYDAASVRFTRSTDEDGDVITYATQWLTLSR